MEGEKYGSGTDLKEPFYPEFFLGVLIGKIIVSWGDFVEVGHGAPKYAAPCTCRGYWSVAGRKSKEFVIVIEMPFD